MAKPSTPTKKVSLVPIAASVRGGTDGHGAVFDVMFRCVFTRGKTRGIRLGQKEMLTVMQFAERSYPEIIKLLAKYPKPKPSKDQVE
jgi:hypothetical protein